MSNADANTETSSRVASRNAKSRDAARNDGVRDVDLAQRRGRVERRPALDVQRQRVRAGIQQDLRRLAVGT